MWYKRIPFEYDMQDIDLYCLPYAGGSARIIYSKWKEHLDPRINIIPLEMAGHGSRMGEKHYGTMEDAIKDLFDSIKDRISDKPYALYGHSMGTVLACELAIVAKKLKLPQPQVIFLSGRKPMHKTKIEKKIYNLSDEDFIKEIVDIGGTPQKLFESETLRKIFLSILRNDYMVVEQYKIRDEIEVLDTDIMFFASDEDTLISPEDVEEWSKCCDGNFECFQYTGGHFFINEHYDDICKKINKKLETDLNVVV